MEETQYTGSFLEKRVHRYFKVKQNEWMSHRDPPFLKLVMFNEDYLHNVEAEYTVLCAKCHFPLKYHSSPSQIIS